MVYLPLCRHDEKKNFKKRGSFAILIMQKGFDFITVNPVADIT